jgi:AraC-like DNA-binding protein
VDSSAGIDATELEPLIDRLVEARENGRLSQIAVYSRPRTSDLRLVQAIARRILCSLILEGVDDSKAFFAALGLRDPGEACDQHEVDSFGALGRLPERVRVVTLEALASRPKPNVKTLASRVGVSRRTVERLFKEAGLPGPAALLRQDCDHDQPIKNPGCRRA